MTDTVGASLPDPRAVSGIDFLLGALAVADQAASSPFGQTVGILLTSAEVGAVEFRLTTRPGFANPLGTLHGGVTASLLDSALGCAVHSTLDAGDWYTTVDLKVSYVRAASLDGACLLARAEAVHVGRSLATAEARVYDEAGGLVAHGTTTCVIRRGAAPDL